MSADPNSAQATVPESEDVVPTAAPTQSGPLEQPAEAVNDGTFQKIMNQGTDFLKIMNQEVDKAISQIDQAATDLTKKVKKEFNKLNEEAQEKVLKEMPNEMKNLLLQATQSLDVQLKVIQQQLSKIKEKKIVDNKFQLLSEAKALVFISQVSFKLIGSAGYGRGVVICKLPDGSWSQPCAVQTAEIGAGWQVGVSRTRFVIPLHTTAQVDALLSDKGQQVSLTGSMQFAFGSDGRLLKAMASGSDQSVQKQNKTEKIAANATIADMQGYDIGIGAAVSAIGALNEVNRRYFVGEDEENLKMSKILDGTVEAPELGRKMVSDSDAVDSKEQESVASGARGARGGPRNGMENLHEARVQYDVLVTMLQDGLDALDVVGGQDVEKVYYDEFGHKLPNVQCPECGDMMKIVGRNDDGGLYCKNCGNNVPKGAKYYVSQMGGKYKVWCHDCARRLTLPKK